MSVRVLSVTGTGAAIDVELGFTPEAVLVFNGNDAGAAAAMLLWSSNMAAASAIKFLAATQAKITTLGITPLTGTAGNQRRGITIGADTDINAVGEVMTVIAFRSAVGSI